VYPHYVIFEKIHKTATLLGEKNLSGLVWNRLSEIGISKRLKQPTKATLQQSFIDY
jgi:hypothetical protein